MGHQGDQLDVTTLIATLHLLPNGSTVCQCRESTTTMIIAEPTPAPPASPRHIPDLSNEAVRADLTEAALEAFFKLTEVWRLNTGQAAMLLDEPPRTYFRIKAGGRKSAMSQDRLTRISA